MDMGLVDSRSWWWTGRPVMLRFIRSQRVGHDWATELNLTEMANKQTKIYSASLVYREMYIKSTIRCCLTPSRMVTTKTQALATLVRRKIRALIHCWWERQMVQPPWKAVWQLLIKLNILLPCDTAIAPSLIFTQRSWKLTFTWNLHTNIYSSFLHDCQNLEATNVTRRMDT